MDVQGLHLRFSRGAWFFIAVLILLVASFKLCLRLPLASDMAIVALALGSCIVHEAAHVIAAAIFGAKLYWVGISETGLYVARDFAPYPAQDILISFAGPLSNAARALLMLSLARQDWVPWVWLANIVMVGVNLLPIEGSDLWNAVSALKRWIRPSPLEQRKPNPH